MRNTLALVGWFSVAMTVGVVARIDASTQDWRASDARPALSRAAIVKTPASSFRFGVGDDRRVPPADPLRPGITQVASGDPPQLTFDTSEVVDVARDEIVFGFDRPIAGASAGAPVRDETFSLSPPVAGKATFLDATRIVFRPESPIAFGVEHTARIEGLRGTNGALQTEPIEVRVRARARIAGKLLTQDPAPGRPRVVAIDPPETEHLAPLSHFSILFDQPVTVDPMTLVRLDDGVRAIVSLATVSHATTFDGYPVRAGSVVEVRPKSPLPNGTKVEVDVLDQTTEHLPVSYAFAVAPDIAPVGLSSDWDAPRAVEGAGTAETTLRFEDDTLHVVFNQNVADPPKGGGWLTFAPPVEGLRVRASGDRLVVDGAFVPGTKYDLVVRDVTTPARARMRSPVHMRFARASFDADVTLPPGPLVLGPDLARAFPVTVRNAREVTIVATRVTTGPWGSEAGEVKTISLAPPTSANVFADVQVDLSRALEPNVPYRLTAKAASPMEDARVPDDLLDGRRDGPIVVVGGTESAAVRVHRVGADAVVHVARLLDGAPIEGARIEAESGSDTAVSSDAHGVAVLRDAGDGNVLVKVSGVAMPLALEEGKRAQTFFPDAPGGEDAQRRGRGFAFTDRGVYRPGALVHAAGFLRSDDGAPVAGKLLRVRLSAGDNALAEGFATTSPTGLVALDLRVPDKAPLGAGKIEVLEAADDDAIVSAPIRIEEFEAPKFLVDVTGRADPTKIVANVRGRYGFGGAMAGAKVRYTVRETGAGEATESPALAREGFVSADEGDGDEPRDAFLSRGEAKLDKDGAFRIELPAPAQRGTVRDAFVVEADVTDESARQVAARTTIVRKAKARHAALRVDTTGARVGQPLDVRVAVAGVDDALIDGARVTVRAFRLDHAVTQKVGKDGAVSEVWSSKRVAIGTCAATTHGTAASCGIATKAPGDHVLVAEVDGQPGGAHTFFVDGDRTSPHEVLHRHEGTDVEVDVATRPFADGEQAEVAFFNPFPRATAILVVQGKGIRHTDAMDVTGARGTFAVPIRAADAPNLFAVLTLVPRDAEAPRNVDVRMGMARIAVQTDAAQGEVTVATDRETYRPGDPVGATVTVMRGGAPLASADVVAAVVDEAVLRLSSHRFPEPSAALHPRVGLDFSVQDSRSTFRSLAMLSHVAGDGEEASGGERAVRARRASDPTVFFSAQLKTDAEGKVRFDFPAPDNLTSYRVLALALGADDTGGRGEHTFRVSKPALIAPALPRFLRAGDRFEAAALVHNAEDRPLRVTARLGDVAMPIEVPARGVRRVATPLTAPVRGPMTFAFRIETPTGEVLDAVEETRQVKAARETMPIRFGGTFSSVASIDVDVDEGFAISPDGLEVRVGPNLYPELGARMSYLLEYPHGCVEQTTSGVFPLLAAREILPELGRRPVGKEELADKVGAGIRRLASMQTSDGGLAYWPGDAETNAYGTAYAARAIALAKRLDYAIDPAFERRLTSYLREQLVKADEGVDTLASFAEALAELRALPRAAALALSYRSREMSLFGRASLTLALASSGDPELVDAAGKHARDLDALLDDRGGLVEGEADDPHAFGSDTRAFAQALIALSRVYPESSRIAPLLSRVTGKLADGSTQAFSYSLLAVLDRIARSRGGRPEVALAMFGLGHEPRGVLDTQVAFSLDGAALSKQPRTSIALTTQDAAPLSFLIEGVAERRAEASLLGRASPGGLEVHRLLTRVDGKPLRPSDVRVGDALRMTLLVRFNEVAPSYLAIEDPMPAGFEAINEDLDSSRSSFEAPSSHPWIARLEGAEPPDHRELRDDRAQFYFDTPGGDAAIVSYLVRATTIGKFAVPPATASLMYALDERASTGAIEVVVAPR